MLPAPRCPAQHESSPVKRLMPRLCDWPALLLIALAALGPVVAAAGEQEAEQVRFFETRVRPILAARCFRCHGADKQKGELRLDSREALISGGSSGDAVVPGK